MTRKLTSQQDVSDLGKRIRDARTSRRISREEMADRLGISAQQYGKYERGANAPTVHAVQKIAAALNINPCDLCGCENDRHQ